MPLVVRDLMAKRWPWPTPSFVCDRLRVATGAAGSWGEMLPSLPIAYLIKISHAPAQGPTQALHTSFPTGLLLGPF